MAIDVYQLCPCGSGKKLKFCCITIAPEMEKVIRFQESEQPRMALAHLERLGQAHPLNAWVVTSHAMLLLHERPDKSLELLRPFLKKNPKHLFAIATYATASFQVDGFHIAKPDIHRAFARCAKIFSNIVGELALEIAFWMFNSQSYMASRQHLALAMRLVSQEERKEVFQRLLDFDNNKESPFPLRSVHTLLEYKGNEESQEAIRRARALSNVGCWSEAANFFHKLTEGDPCSPELWHNVGLCRAWDGDEVLAAEAFHKAAQLHTDFEAAVDCETIAQLLDLKSPEQQVEIDADRYRVASVSRLLILLGEHDRLLRLPGGPSSQELEYGVAGVFQVLDREAPPDYAGEEISVEEIPQTIGQLAVYNASDPSDEPAEVIVSGYDVEKSSDACKLIREIVGDELELIEPDSDTVPMTSVTPRQWLPLTWRWNFAPKTPMHLRRRLELEQWEKLIDEGWAKNPLSALGDKSPEDASEISELKLPLTAAVRVLDAYCETRQYTLDVETLGDKLHIEQARPIDIEPETKLNTFTAMQLIRLPVDRLSDTQLLYVMNRALIISHSSFLFAILIEVLSRPECSDKSNPDRSFSALAEICQRRNRTDEALEWIQKGKQAAADSQSAFEETLNWEMRELGIRLENPTDPVVNQMIVRLNEYYGPKLPKFRDHLEKVLDTFGVEPPWNDPNSILVAGAEAAGSPPDQVWTPGATPHSDESKKKLWLPGQD